MTASVVEDYLHLGLRLGRHVEGMVDAYYGPPELAAAVDAEPPADPSALVEAAENLLARLDDGWLRDQTSGLLTYARVLAGAPLGYADEVEGCYGVRPAYTDENVFAAAHARLDELLPGPGPLAERYARWQASTRVPADHIQPTVAAVIEEARRQTGRLVELPEGEDVGVEIVRDVPWLGFCEYLGDLRSEISVNVTLPMSAIELLILVLHETYPGHHTERCMKEQVLVRGRALLEETLVLVPTPQSVIAEGIATLAPGALLDGADAPALACVVHDVAGVELDVGHAQAVERALEPCRWAEVNAALMLFERGASEADAHAYLQRWSLMTPEFASHLIRFFNEPTSRSYIVTYPAGRELCGAFVAREVDGFRRLLTEQVRVRDLLVPATQPETGSSSPKMRW